MTEPVIEMINRTQKTEILFANKQTINLLFFESKCTKELATGVDATEPVLPIALILISKLESAKA